MDEDFSGEVAWFELYVALFPDDKVTSACVLASCVFGCARDVPPNAPPHHVPSLYMYP